MFNKRSNIIDPNKNKSLGRILKKEIFSKLNIHRQNKKHTNLRDLIKIQLFISSKLKRMRIQSNTIFHKQKKINQEIRLLISRDLN